MHQLLNLALLFGPEAATAAPPAGGAQSQQAPAGCAGGGGMQSLVFMGLMFVVFWFILIRPQQKRAKEHANMLTALKRGDTVITRGGIIGKVTGVQDTVVTIEVQEKVRMRVAKSYVEGLHADPAVTNAAAKSAAPSDAKT